MSKKWWQTDEAKVVAASLAWQAVLLGAAVVFTRLNWPPFAPSYPRAELIATSPLPQWLARLGGFDGVHYQTIVEQGYVGTGGIQAFFPLYPLVVWLVNCLVRQPLAAGLAVSSLSLTLGLVLIFRLVKQRWGRAVAGWFVAILLTGPASFFYLTVYSESLFLLLLAGTLSAYWHRQYGWVAVWGAALSACRIVGVVVVAALCLDKALEWGRSGAARRSALARQILIISLGGLGLVAYMAYLTHYFHDPLYFMTVQASFGGGRDTQHLVLLPQVLWRYFKMIRGGFTSWPTAYATWQELAISCFYLGGLAGAAFQSWRRRQLLHPLDWWLFSAGFFLIPTTTGHFGSMPRYVLPCWLVTLILAKFFPQKRLWGVIFCLVSWSIMLFNLCLFLQGYWVA